MRNDHHAGHDEASRLASQAARQGMHSQTAHRRCCSNAFVFLMPINAGTVGNNVEQHREGPKALLGSYSTARQGLTCARMAMRAAWRMKQDLPPILGPVTTIALRASPCSVVLFGVTPPSLTASSTAWRPPRMSSWGGSSGPTNEGRTYLQQGTLTSNQLGRLIRTNK